MYGVGAYVPMIPSLVIPEHLVALYKDDRLVGTIDISHLQNKGS